MQHTVISRSLDLAPPIDGPPEPFRLVFVPPDVEEMSIGEIAARLGIRAETVKVRPHRARRLLRQAPHAQLASVLSDAFPFAGARCARIVETVSRRLENPPSGREAAGIQQNDSRERSRRTIMKRLVAIGLAAALASPAFAADKVEKAPPSGAYKKVSSLVKLPDFLPGLGELYVDPKTLPAGPFLAYDHQGKLVSTIYMIPIEKIDAQQKFDDLAAPGGKVDHVDLYYNAGHPGVEMPHYHIVMWHVPKADEARVAK